MDSWEKLLVEREELLQSTITSLKSNEQIIIDELNKSNDQPGVVAKYTQQLTDFNIQIETKKVS